MGITPERLELMQRKLRELQKNHPEPGNVFGLIGSIVNGVFRIEWGVEKPAPIGKKKKRKAR